MKKVFNYLYTAIALIAWFAACYTLGGPEGLIFAQIAPVALNDKGIIKQWRRLSQDAFWLSQLKTTFSGPGWTGTTKSRRNIHTREDIMGAPLLEYYDLSRLKGDRLTDTVHIPPFDGDEEWLFGAGDHKGYIRVKGQNRIKFEIQGHRRNIDFALQSFFLAAVEQDINMSEQELGGELLPLLIEHLSQTGAQFQDADKLTSFFLHYSPHVYQRIAQADASVSNNDPAPASPDLGVLAPYEHPNTFAWINEGSLSEPKYKLISAAGIPNATAADGHAATSWAGKVHEAVSQVDSTALPGIQMLDQIMYAIVQLRIVPIQFLTVDGELESFYYLLVSPAMMNMFFNDPGLQKRFDAAYNGVMYRHQLVNESDKIYRRLIIKQIEKLDQELYTYKRCFGGEYDYGDTDKGGHNDRDGLASGQDVLVPIMKKDTTTGSGRDLRTFMEIRNRVFRRYISDGDTNVGAANAGAATPAGNDDAIGAAGGDKIDRMILMGASAHGCVPGPVFPLERRQEDDYGNIIGIGQEKLYASRRIEFPTTRSHPSGKDNQSSFVVAAFNGK